MIYWQILIRLSLRVRVNGLAYLSRRNCVDNIKKRLKQISIGGLRRD